MGSSLNIHRWEQPGGERSGRERFGTGQRRMGAGLLLCLGLLALWVGYGLGATAVAQANPLDSLIWGGRWQVRTDADFSDTDGPEIDSSLSLRLQGRTATFPWRAFFDGRIGLKGPLAGSSDSWKVDGELDRLYARYYASNGFVSLGKQFVNWG